jgi:glycosyltransferase involved in cell wall biosynthesis
MSVGAGYDLVGRAAGLGGDHVVVGRDLVRADGSAGDGLVASLVEADEIVDSASRPAIEDADGPRLSWAGRLVDGKGLEALIDALRSVPGARLTLIGDGPARDPLAALADRQGVGGRVEFVGHVADRATYLRHLAASDFFVFPSPAEGFPKVILDAAAVGLPILASASGSLDELTRARVVMAVDAGRADSIAAAIRMLAGDADEAARLRAAGHRLVTGHTRSAEAERLIERWRARWPRLPWGDPDTR